MTIDKAISEIISTNYGEVQCHQETMVLAVAAEREGRLVVLPCKVGDTVYCLENNTIYEDKIHEIKISENETFFNLDFGDRFSVWIPIERIGKTVFLTRAEAEKGEGE